MSELKQVDRRPRECCNHPENLTREQVARDRYIEHCVCGNKHYVVTLDPLALNLTAASAG